MEVKKLTSVSNKQLAQMAAYEKENEKMGLLPFSEDILQDCIVKQDTFACLDGEKILGFLTINPRSKRYAEDSFYIININVGSRYRRRGIARKLLLAAWEYYKEEPGDKIVFLDVMKENPAINLYEQVGFRCADIPSKMGIPMRLCPCV